MKLNQQELELLSNSPGCLGALGEFYDSLLATDKTLSEDQIEKITKRRDELYAEEKRILEELKNVAPAQADKP